MGRLARTLWLASLLASHPVFAQIGGDGHDGALHPTISTTIDVDSRVGVFHYTSVSIPFTVTVRLVGNHPVIWHVQGDCSIYGTVDLRGADASTDRGGAGGPGGWRGSDGVAAFGTAFNGEGPGGGVASGTPGFLGGPAGHAVAGMADSGAAPGGPPYGTAFPFDLRGGSGGAGEHASGFQRGEGGGGGGGTFVILCDGVITVAGTIDASGGHGSRSGAGSGGSLMLRSLQGVTVMSSGALLTAGHATRAGESSDGFTRVEAYASTPDIQGWSRPTPEARTLPHLRDLGPARIGTTYELVVTSCPTDYVTLFFSSGGAVIPLPPFGTGLLDPVIGILNFGSTQLPATGHDPQAAFLIPVPNDPLLIGFPVHFQVMTFPTPTNRPYLSNDVVRSIAS